MNVLFVIAHRDAGRCLRGLSDACRRKGVGFSIFFTGDGVRALSGAGVAERAGRAVEAVVCEHSWRRTMEDRPCPIALGSQTDHSRMLASANRVVSL